MKDAARFMLSAKADFGVMYDAELDRLGLDGMKAHGMTRERYIQIYEESGCPSLGFLMDGKPIGGIVVIGDEAHIAVLSQCHGRWAFLWKPAMQWLFSLRQKVYGFIEPDNKKGLRLLEKDGWNCIGPVEKYNKTCIGFVMTAEERLKRFETSKAGKEGAPAR